MSPTRGEGPIIDLVLVKDYAAGSSDSPRLFFRIHNDLPISEAEYGSLETALKKHDLDAIYSLLAKPHERDGEWRRAVATLKGALSKDP